MNETKSESYPRTEELECLSCKKHVLVELYPKGGGYAGVCPICKELAYYGEKYISLNKG